MVVATPQKGQAEFERNRLALVASGRVRGPDRMAGEVKGIFRVCCVMGSAAISSRDRSEASGNGTVNDPGTNAQ